MIYSDTKIKDKDISFSHLAEKKRSFIFIFENLFQVHFVRFYLNFVPSFIRIIVRTNKLHFRFKKSQKLKL